MAAKVERLVHPVRVDPRGQDGPTRGQAAGPGWRRTGPGLFVPAAVDDGRVGARPLNQPARTLRGNAEYRPGFAPGFSVDVAVANIGSRYASRDNVVSVPSYTLVDVGARYRFRIGKAPATLRVQMQNVGDVFAWNIVGSNSYGLMDKRRVSIFLLADF